MSDMGQPLGRMAGNWIELVESVELLRGERPAQSEDLRELSLRLAGWMVHLGGKAETAKAGYAAAERALTDDSALRVFFAMVEAQGGEASVFDDPAAFHRPGATAVLEAWQSGYIASTDTTQIGWAVQRTGAGRERAGEPVDPHAGIEFHARRGTRVEAGEPIATIYATRAEMLAEPIALLRQAITIAEASPAPVELVSRVITKETAEAFLASSLKSENTDPPVLAG
jgi:pyrimidine-nucleoside phosphorylase